MSGRQREKGTVSQLEVWMPGVGVLAGLAPFVVPEGALAPFPSPSFSGLLAAFGSLGL